MDQWSQYLYRDHSERELAEWAKRLKWFRFCRAFGGHANDGDQLIVALAHSGGEDIEALWNELGLASPSGGTVQILGVSLNSTRLKDRVLLSLSGADGDPFQVTARDVAKAQAVERALQAVRSRLIDPPIDDRHCVAPKYYLRFRTREWIRRELIGCPIFGAKEI